MSMLTAFQNEAFESIACNLCGGQQTRLLTTRSRLDVPLNTVVCQRCGLVYHNPRMTAAGFARFYENDYRHFLAEEAVPNQVLFERQQQHGRAMLAFVGAALPRGGRVLDIGSGPGGQLWFLRETHGCAVVGIEPAREHAAWAQREYGLDIRPGMLEEVTLPPGQQDLVIISQTLNHLLDPLGALQLAHTWLRPGGYVFVEVIDFLAWIRVASLPQATTIDHPYMFVPATLQAMLAQAGFQVEKWERDADRAQRAAHQLGQPTLHMRALARQVPPTSPSYPAAAQVWQQIRAAERAYQGRQTRRRLAERWDQAKGHVRRRLGEGLWQQLRRLKR